MLSTQVLQAARLKGRITDESAAGAAGVDVATADREINRLCAAGMLQGEAQFRLSPEGRAHLDELLELERHQIDQEALAQVYDEFDAHNTAMKSLMSDWQMRGGEPNDHTDEAYDAAVLRRFADLHEGFGPVVDAAVELASRLAPYRGRFDRAIANIAEGDHAYVARPMMDSYHTVWFELHEELIGLLGRTRLDEAVAGRAV